ncbi:MAG TPA: tetraacyldisaccharide 4'-kinase [Chitinophagaceae bacterium]|nr:tetraacyldisaccharide 4'-kinase [Chitinophagaceae bacterium]
MNFNFPLLRPIRMLLFPFSLIYALIIFLRNRLYDRHVFASTSFNMPLICVGNLSVGGTGKSPMVELMVKHLKGKYRIAVLSRGYKRKTKGYALANERSTALEIGDEPMQFHVKFPDVAIAVGEERMVAIPQLLHDRPSTQAIILDDAFQHRVINAGLNILLTDYNNLYTRDWFLPTGDLRDEPGSARRASIIVITKCPADLSQEEREALTREIRPREYQRVFFSTLQYERPYHIIHRDTRAITTDDEVLMVTGIANPRSLKQYLLEYSRTYYEMSYSDHHIFTIDDLREIRMKFEQVTADNKIIITTEKDAVRLLKFEQELRELPCYVLPIGHHFLFGEAQSFMDIIGNFISTYKR